MNYLTKLYHLRLLGGFFLAAPALVSLLWLSSAAFTQMEAYRRSVKDPEPWSGSLFQLSLHDRMESAQRSLWFAVQAPWRSLDFGLPVINLELKSQDFARLLKTDFSDQLKGYLWSDEQPFEVKLRPLGQKHWHRLGPKPSLKLDLKRGDLVHNLRYLRLSNPHRPLFMRDAVFLDLAHEMGLLSAQIQFIWLRINGENLGVYALSHRPEERSLRQAQRFPAHIYSIDHLSEKAQKRAWQDASAWEQVGETLPQESRLDLQRLLTWVQGQKIPDAPDYAETEINLQAFARLAALNILFGEEKFQNFDLYFDPYQGQWEPMVFASDGFHHLPRLHLQAHPLFQALETSSDYLKLRHEALQELLDKASGLKLEQRFKSEIERLSPALQQDIYWQAKNQWADTSPFRHQLMRPMRLADLDDVLKQQMFEYQVRERWVREFLNQETLPLTQSSKSTQLILGPGTVHIPHNRIFGSQEKVVVKAGTRFLMGPAAALIFRGPVIFEGHAQNPIIIQAQNPQQPWGGIVLQGPQTAGSQLKGLRVLGGTTPHWRRVSYPGTLNIHHSQNIVLHDLILQRNQNADDFIHLAYVKELKASKLQVHNSFSDALDLEFCDASIDNLRVLQAGDDAIDLMGTALNLQQSQLLQAQGNGISVGEESQLKAATLLIADSDVGILSKHASSVQLDQSFLFRNEVGWEVHQFSPHYPGASQLQATDVLRLKNKKDQELDERSAAHVRDLRPLQQWQQAATLGTLWQSLALEKNLLSQSGFLAWLAQAEARE